MKPACNGKRVKPSADKATATSRETSKKRNATLSQRIEILNWYHQNGKNQTKTAKHFVELFPDLQIKQLLISAWVKDEAKWRDEWNKANGQQAQASAKHACQTVHPEITEMMDLWVMKAQHDKVLLTGEVLRQKWRKYAGMRGIPEEDRLGLSEGWLTSFKVRNGLKNYKRHEEASSADVTHAEEERARIKEIILNSGYGMDDIFNMDETGLYYG